MTNDIRNNILNAFDIILSRSGVMEPIPSPFNELVKTIEAQLDTYGNFTLTRIAYGYFVSFVTSSGMQIDPDALLHAKNQLLGKIPYWNTYLINHNLASLLKEESLKLYEQIILLMDMLKQTHKIGSNEYKQLRNSVEEICYLVQVNTLAELLVAHLANILSRLPDQELAVYDPMGIHKLPYRLRYSSIRPKESTVSVWEQLRYCESMLQKLKGEEILFVDVHLTMDGYLINLR